MKKILLILIIFITFLAGIIAINRINIPSPIKSNLHNISIENFI